MGRNPDQDRETWRRENPLLKLIRVLQTAYQVGYTSLSSPTGVLLDTLLDLSLLLKEDFLSPKLGRKLNRDIKFLYSAPQDELGNTKSISVGPKSEREFGDPDGFNFFKEFAIFVLGIKNHLPIRQAFLELAKRLRFIPPTKLEVPKAKEHTTSSSRKSKRLKVRAYWKRRRSSK